ncbi:lasso RiPP family leader peptide-containing protein [Halobacteria archaeon AArc-m2/3/4]|uniref:Lasso RiPP family leader peptide-containing protein n=1 Tax=Natronoglomus mannanivorans TaxID=2979990 RepID=A0AAP2Z1K5_9EURY|nr:lasso RiPP family leader peptide-containing protein [Halobacteria archaeon AArc-xg1-1]MCU4974882.1 lasso RiPP family leader peptide-containing protein [Halobacteria archaeon AArc-m2/3/4]
MSEQSTKTYETPEVTEYGSVESITMQNKIGSGEDEYSELTPLVGSVQ